MSPVSDTHYADRSFSSGGMVFLNVPNKQKTEAKKKEETRTSDMLILNDM